MNFYSLVTMWILIWACYALISPLGFAEVIINLYRMLVVLYNWCIRQERNQIIHQVGEEHWQRTYKAAARLAKKAKIPAWAMRQMLIEDKQEFIEIFGTEYVKKWRPELFEEKTSDYDNFL